MVPTQQQNKRQRLLQTLRDAVVAGATWQYESLVGEAMRAGATDEEIDAVVHQVLEALLAGAETPLTSRQLAHERSGGHDND